MQNIQIVTTQTNPQSAFSDAKDKKPFLLVQRDKTARFFLPKLKDNILPLCHSLITDFKV